MGGVLLLAAGVIAATAATVMLRTSTIGGLALATVGFTAIGIGVIQAVNVVRVSALFLIGLYFHQLFHETHVYVAQALVVCVAIALWLSCPR